jgi:hypothetical protein
MDWIDFLTFAGLLYSDGKCVRLEIQNQLKAKEDTNPRTAAKRGLFSRLFISIYQDVVIHQRGIRTVELELLRRELALRAYGESGELITGRQFDALLTDFPKTSDDYTLTFGRSMGREEKLFQLRGKFFQTVAIRFSG